MKTTINQTLADGIKILLLFEPLTSSLTVPKICQKLGAKVRAIVPAEKSWYKVDETDIPIQSDNAARQIVPLSKLSSVITGLKPIRKRMAYCSLEDKTEALELVTRMEGKKR